jgi:hypothetical protein
VAGIRFAPVSRPLQAVRYGPVKGPHPPSRCHLRGPQGKLKGGLRVMQGRDSLPGGLALPRPRPLAGNGRPSQARGYNKVSASRFKGATEVARLATAAPEAPSRGSPPSGSEAIIRSVLAGSNGPPQGRQRGHLMGGSGAQQSAGREIGLVLLRSRPRHAPKALAGRPAP